MSFATVILCSAVGIVIVKFHHITLCDETTVFVECLFNRNGVGDVPD
jgi:hypothetical protein